MCIYESLLSFLLFYSFVFINVNIDTIYPLPNFIPTQGKQDGVPKQTLNALCL